MTMLSKSMSSVSEARGVSSDLDRVSVVVPTLNARPYLNALLPALADQGLRRDQFLFIDSASTDGCVEAFREFGAKIVEIDRNNFNHGGTRQLAVEHLSTANIVVMMTQDAIPAGPDAIACLVAAFSDEKVGMAYGRQLPRVEARGIERHARLLNYPDRSETRAFDDRIGSGLKTIFCSDSFAAYRKSALDSVGGFPQDAFFAEDQIVAARMLINGWSMAYRGDAQVIHSHGYSIADEFRRYFDVGVFHGRNPWLLETFGAATGEGLRFIRSELGYLAKHDPVLLGSAMIRTFSKYAGYKLGMRERTLPISLKRRLSMQPFYWKNIAPMSTV